MSLTNEVPASKIQVDEEFFAEHHGAIIKLKAIGINKTTQQIYSVVTYTNDSLLWSVGDFLPLPLGKTVYKYDAPVSVPKPTIPSLPTKTIKPYINPNAVPASSHHKGQKIKIVDPNSKYSKPPNSLFEILEITKSGPVKITPYPENGSKPTLIRAQTLTVVA
jgi:hypothetical protein